MTRHRVLVVDDAEEISDLVAAVLDAAGHDVKVVASGVEALVETRAWEPDVVILDLSLPDLDGVEVCRALRTFSSAFVLMLTARGDEIDRVVGLTVGADDYVTKPFSPRELAARVAAVLRRGRAAAVQVPPSDRLRRVGPLRLDVEAREVALGDRAVVTTKLEFDILDALTEHPRRVVTREQLRERVWGPGWFGDDHAVDVHVSNLRKKLAAAGSPAVISTVRGVGYRVAPELLTDAS